MLFGTAIALRHVIARLSYGVSRCLLGSIEVVA